MFHFVVWDGKVIYNEQFASKVNKTQDCTNTEMSKMAFAKIYPKSEFTSWQITSVYQLVSHSVIRFIHTVPETGPIIHLHKGQPTQKRGIV